MDPVVKPRDDTGDFTGLRNNIELGMHSTPFLSHATTPT
nr:hypothetical protein [Rickettsia honei]